jgi:molybdate transport system substrate-binding protein
VKPVPGLLLLLLLAASGRARGEELLVFAAASLTEVLEEVARGYETASGNDVVFNFAGSNDLARQLRAGAPADVFFSADVALVEELERAGTVAADERTDLLSNVLAVVVAKDAASAPATAADLKGVRHLALADPDTVPAGRYARAWLQARGLWEALQAKVVPTLDVRAALAAVEAGHADAAVVYRTDAAVSRRVRVAFEVPRAEGPAITYAVAPLARSTRDARGFVRHLRSPAARAVYERAGFVVLAPKC